jgi:hypothetical protein
MLVTRLIKQGKFFLPFHEYDKPNANLTKKESHWARTVLQWRIVRIIARLEMGKEKWGNIFLRVEFSNKCQRFFNRARGKNKKIPGPPQQSLHQCLPLWYRFLPVHPRIILTPLFCLAIRGVMEKRV